MDIPNQREAPMRLLTRKPQRGFSLVELSIVLVILGLLVGGILAGQSLIRASELRSASTEFDAYRTAVFTFRDKYMAFPGDMPNATQFWGTMTNCGVASPSGTGTQTCDGDFNGLINSTPSAASRTGERFMIWQHLANAGMIKGNYTGIAGSGNKAHAIPNVNVPASRMTNGAWFASYWGVETGGTMLFDRDYGNAMTLGTITATTQPYDPLFSSEEGWNVDTKIDDGQPARGKVVVRNRVGCTLKSDGSVQTTASADAADLDSTYHLASSGYQCSLLFLQIL